MGSRLEANSDATRKRIAAHVFEDEDGDEYEGSAFGGFTDYFRRKKLKLQNLDADIRSQSADKPQIFKGVVAHVNGYTQPSLNDLHVLIVQHGGGFLQYLDGKTAVTHIIASSLTPRKAVEFKSYRIVKPAWVVDSIKEGKLLPWTSYRVVDEGEKQKVLAFRDGKVTTQASLQRRGYRDQSDSSWYTEQLKGNQAGTPSGTPRGTPSSTLRSRFLKQKLPAQDDGVDEGEIEDLPPSHQPELPDSSPASEPPLDTSLPSENDNLQSTLVTPPQTIPSFAPQRDAQLDDVPEEHPPKQKAQLTAEEHNAILLSDPKIRKSTVVDPNFLEQYYRESRLHHLSTWKADLKSQMQALASEKTSSQQNRHKRPPGARRYILHVDFDSFFAAVSLKENPQWKDKPAVVAHGPGNGSEIASCNYPARKFGVKNGMWMKRAMELCPDLKVLPYDFPAYEEASRAFYDAILATDGIVQSVSIDEALIDVSNQCIAVGGSNGKGVSEGSIYREQAKAEEIALALREEVKRRTECNISVGIGGNILLAKVALRKAKPADQYQIKPEEVLDFIGQLQVQDLPGVAWSIGGKLEEIGVKFVKDIREVTKEKLVQTLGPKTGEKLWEYSRGIDRTEVAEQVVRKSVSAEVNWGVRFENQEQADEFIGSLCGELQKRLLKEKVKGKQFTMKVMRRSQDAPLDPPKHLGHGKCDTYNKSLVLGVATNAKEVLTKEALSILKGFGFSPGELRGIGVQMTKLEPMKSANDGSLESSQRRLQFKVGNTNTEPTSARKPPKLVEADLIQDDPQTPKKPKDHVPFGAPELNHSTPSRRPLNTLGTQFILPTQVDPKILEQLPSDIRSKLIRQTRTSSPTPAPEPRPSRDPSPSTPSKGEARRTFALTALPAVSQLDDDVLAHLPEDVRAEVLAQYAATPGSPSRSPHGRFRADQTLLPQSPRKNRIIAIPDRKYVRAPVKRGRGRPPRSAMLAASARATARGSDGRTLKQASFVFGKKDQVAEKDSAFNEVYNAKGERIKGNEAGAWADVFARKEKGKGKEEDQKFLFSPQPKRLVLRDEGGNHEGYADVDADAHIDSDPTEDINGNFHSDPDTAPSPIPQIDHNPSRERIIKIPHPRKPTLRGLSETNGVREALKQWVHEFHDSAPFDDDVNAIKKYLQRVVRDEKDMGKAVELVKWVRWCVDESVDCDGVEGDGFGGVREKWREVVEGMERSVNEAARERGLGVVNFEL